MPLAGQPQVDGYELGPLIGRGGSALVYRATQVRFGRAVALKVLDEAFDERGEARFVRECQALGRVSGHPGIITVYDAGATADHRGWLAMELLSGGSLGDRLRQVGALPIGEVLLVAERLADALEAAHRQDIIHRDVKPQNVLLSAYGQPVLSDFGIAANLADAGTATSAFTPVHAAPEVLQGGVATPATDVYSLASTLWMLLTGTAPFARRDDEGPLQHLERIVRDDPPVADLIAVTSSGLAEVLNAGLAKDPARRPLSAAQLAHQLASSTNVRPEPSLAATPEAVSQEVLTEIEGESPTVLRDRDRDARRPVDGALDGGQPLSVDEEPESATVLGGRAQVLPRPVPAGVDRTRPRWMVPAMVVLVLGLACVGLLVGSLLGNDDGDQGAASVTIPEGTPEQQASAIPAPTSVSIVRSDASGVVYRLEWEAGGPDQAMVISSRSLDAEWPGTVLTLGGVLPVSGAGEWTTPEPLAAGARCFALGALNTERAFVFDYDQAICVDEAGRVIEPTTVSG